IVDRGSPLRVVSGGNRPLGLVEAEQTGRLGWADRPSVDGEAADVVQQGRGRGDLFTMQCDTPLCDHALDLAARRDAGPGKQFGDALRHRFLLRSLRLRSHTVGVSMLFGKRKRIVKRILIVEDEPLTAFDTETMLADFGY